MGLFGNFSFSDLYNKAKAVVSDVYGAAKKGVGMIKQGKDWISEQVDKLSAIPFVGSEIKDLVDKTTETPFLFGASLNDVGRLVDRANEFINSPYLQEAAQKFDQLAQSATRSADQAIAGYAG